MFQSVPTSAGRSKVARLRPKFMVIGTDTSKGTEPEGGGPLPTVMVAGATPATWDTAMTPRAMARSRLREPAVTGGKENQATLISVSVATGVGSKGSKRAAMAAPALKNRMSESGGCGLLRQVTKGSRWAGS